MKKALITGITGQDGSYLAEFLLKKNYKVYGLVRRLSNPNYNNIKHIINELEIIEGDITDVTSLIKLLEENNPDEVYNLAAQSFVATSWKQPILTTEVNAVGTLNILEAIRSVNPKIKFYQASTSEMFGNANLNGYQYEEVPFHPRSPYAISKLYAHWVTINYRESYNLFACCGILFNHESPRRGIEFVTRKITYGVARIKLGLSNELILGNLDSKRDWGFAGDYVEVMWLMLQRENPDDFVIATGETHSVKDFVIAAFDAVGIKDWQKYVKQDKRYMRPAEVDYLKGKPERAFKILNWKPRIKFNELVKMMVESDLKLIKNEGTNNGN